MVSLLANKQAAIQELCQQHSVKRLEVFGSAAKHNLFDPEQSDVDLLVEFLPDKDLGPWLKHFFTLRDNLASTLDRPVDLVLASSLKNPRFVNEVQRTRQLIYESKEL